MRIPNPKAVTTTEAYLAYKAEVLEQSELKDKLYHPYLHIDGWLAYWTGLTDTYPNDGIATGKNLFNPKNTTLGYFYINNLNLIPFSQQPVSVYMEISPNTTYTVTKPILNNNRFGIGTCAAIPSPGGTLTISHSNNDTDHLTITSGENDKWLVIYFKQGSDTTPVETIFSQIQVEEGSSATEYEPFQATPEIITDEEAYIAYLAGVTSEYPEALKDPADVRVASYLRYLVSARFGRPDYPVTREEFYLSMMKPRYIPSGDPSSEIELDGTVEAPFIDVKMYGDTFQQTYSGKNLINNLDTTYDYSNVADRYITMTSLPTGLSFENTYPDTGAPVVVFKVFDGTPYIGKTIRLKANFDVEDSVYRIIRMDSNAGNRSVLATSYESGKEISYTIPDNLGSTNYFGFGFGSNAGATVNYTNLIMTIDNADMTYEPYVGGIPAPNPDYPQDIDVVTGEQNVWVHGKNMFDKTSGTLVSINVSGNTRWGYKLPKVTNDFYFTKSIDDQIGFRLVEDVNGSIVSLGDVYTMNSATKFTNTSNDMYVLCFATQNQQNAQRYFDNNNFMMSYTNVAYEPYQGQNYTVNLTSKNLFDKTLTPYSSNHSTASQITNGIRVASTINATTSSLYVLYLLGNTKDYIGKTLTLSANMQASASNVPRVMLGLCDSSGGNASGKVNLYENGSVSYQVENDTTRQYLFLAIYSTAGGTVQVGDYVDYTNIQLEVGSATPYTPYFTPIELCKLGDYQDYIYRDEDGDWYVHKDCGKYVFTGSESWQSSPYGTNSWSSYNILSFPFDTTKLQIMSEAFRGVPHNRRGTAGDNIIYVAGNNLFEIRNTSLTSLANVQSATNGTNLYYALATPTDTQITNSELIAQLDALMEGGSYNDKTYIKVTATDPNLPGLLYVEAAI